jgi:hypothetical protein
MQSVVQAGQHRDLRRHGLRSKMGGMISDDFLQLHGFARSDDWGWEKVWPPTGERWVRWHAGDLFLGNADEMDPTIDGPPLDKLIRGGVNSEAELLRVVAEACL